jgi:chromate transporter
MLRSPRTPCIHRHQPDEPGTPGAPGVTLSVTASLERPRSPLELFGTFMILALQGFGGVVVVAQRVLCEEKRWLTRAEFVELLSLGQVIPGPNVCNIALMLGERFFGWRGALAALGGLVALPFAIVLTLTALYVRWAANPAISGALRGMEVVSAGLIAGTSLKLAHTLRHSPLGVPLCVTLSSGAFVCVAVLHVPLAWTLLALGGAGWALAWQRLGGGGA